MPNKIQHQRGLRGAGKIGAILLPLITRGQTTGGARDEGNLIAHRSSLAAGLRMNNRRAVRGKIQRNVFVIDYAHDEPAAKAVLVAAPEVETKMARRFHEQRDQRVGSNCPFRSGSVFMMTSPAPGGNTVKFSVYLAAADRVRAHRGCRPSRACRGPRRHCS